MDRLPNGHPDANATPGAPLQLPRPHCSCAHPGCGSFARPAPAQWGYPSGRESIELLSHRASFAESAFYAILHSHALKEKAEVAEVTKIDKLAETVETLAQQSLTLSQNFEVSNGLLQEKLDATILEMATGQTTYELKLEDMKDTFKASIEELRAELQESTTKLVEDLNVGMREAVADLQGELREARETLAQREAELFEAKEALTNEKLDHVVSNNHLESLSDEVHHLKESQANDAAEIQELRLQVGTHRFAVEQILSGEYSPVEWVNKASEDLVPLNLGSDLTTLGHKLLAMSARRDVTVGDGSTIEEPPFAVADEPMEEPPVAPYTHEESRGPISELGSDVKDEPQEEESLPDWSVHYAAVDAQPDWDTPSPPTPVPESSKAHISRNNTQSTFGDEYEHVADPSKPQSVAEVPAPRPPPPAVVVPNIVTPKGRTATALVSTVVSRKMVQEALVTKQNRLALKQGETITDVVFHSSTLWQGTNAQGTRGYFKSKHVRLR